MVKPPISGAHAAAHVGPGDAERLHRELLRQWEQPYEHQLIPRTLLRFITDHIQYQALGAIYELLTRNFSIGRSIPKLVSPDKNAENCKLYQRCIEASAILDRGDGALFAKAAAEMFEQTRSLVAAECRRLGYWEAAARVYDGEALWR